MKYTLFYLSKFIGSGRMTNPAAILGSADFDPRRAEIVDVVGLRTRTRPVIPQAARADWTVIGVETDDDTHAALQADERFALISPTDERVSKASLEQFDQDPSITDDKMYAQVIEDVQALVDPRRVQ